MTNDKLVVGRVMPTSRTVTVEAPRRQSFTVNRGAPPRQPPRDAVGASGEWPSLEARAQHIASAISTLREGGVRWRQVYDRALAHLRAVTGENQ